MDELTKVGNPVNEIASLLQETGVVGTAKPEEVTEEDTPVEEPQEVSQSQPEETETETPDKVYFNDILEDIDIAIEDAYEMSLKMPDMEPMTLGELKNFAIDNRDIETTRAELKQRELDLQARAEQAETIPKVSNELMQARAQVLAIQESYNSQNWDAIRQSNPAEWSAMQTEYQQRFAAAKSQEAAAENHVNTQLEQAKAYQRDRLFESMPELKDDKVRTETAQIVQKMVSDFGIPSNHLENVDDANVMRMLITLSKMYSAKDSVKTKMADNTPRSSKPNAAKPIPSTRKLALKRLTEKAKATGQRRDQVNAVNALLS
jgi:hypothetical protein